MRRIARENSHDYAGLLAPLLGVMAMDSQNHDRILRFVLGRLQPAR